MHKGHYSDSYHVLARCSCRFAGSIGTICFVCRVCPKVIIDPWTDHLQDHPMGRNPTTFVHILGALHPRSGVPIQQLSRKLQSSPEFTSQGARIKTFTISWEVRKVLTFTFVTCAVRPFLYYPRFTDRIVKETLKGGLRC